ncbi:hypothetical protein PSECIP111951_02634 [Pseudoalteromonas holothuriae]|uniref:PKD domain-containing protein n=1 Tax=Pseudoalteromonas holothuriae TaxID=2963714 RepID=A0ABM9GJT5_9GAMM|nr:GEVED domain-containing protein [Pseudoalteromonas sp. CIP111951]CAH9062149.1 hypothetical protein PSECIP111951_02634 [Pseudoalteromonas sp. CIP111951]
MKHYKLKKIAAVLAVTASFSSIAQEVTLFNHAIAFENESSKKRHNKNISNKETNQVAHNALVQSVELNTIAVSTLKVGDLISLMIDGKYIQIELTRVTRPQANKTLIDGKSYDNAAKLSMININGRYSAKITINDVGYLLTPSQTDSSIYKLSKFKDDKLPVDDSNHPQTNTQLNVLTVEGLSNALSKTLSSATNTPQVTVIVAYTEKLAQEIGDVDAYLALMEKDTNDSYAASGINASVSIIHSYQTGYKSTGDMAEDNSTLLNENSSDWLKNPNPLAPNGYGQELKSLRDEHQADVMVFLADKDKSSPWAGWAGEIGTDEKSALFTLSSWGTFKNTFAHELGHLYGARHDNDSTTTPFAYGHGYCNDAKTWRTMMAISDCGERLNAWSNPDQIYKDEAGGTVATNNNARVHNERAATMAALRTSAHIAPTATITQANTTTNNLTVTFAGQATDQDGMIASTLWDFGDGVYSNEPYAEGDNVSHTYQFPGTYTVRYTATDNHGLINSVSTEITVTALPGTGYCAAKATNALFQHTQSVKVNSLKHDTWRRQYTDQTTKEAFTAYAGSATGIELQQGTRGNKFGPYAAYWAVYIDLNQDNVFSNDELLHYALPRTIQSHEPVLGNITIPETALAGTTRMRVLQSYQLRDGEAQLAACGDFTWGEVEDYKINIVKEANPAEFSANTTVNDLTVGFSGITNSDVASVEWDFGDGTYSRSSTSTEFSPNHTYLFSGSYTVTLTITLKNGQTVTHSKVIEVTAPAGQDYCKAYGNQPKYQFNANVTLNGTGVTSGSTPYSDHTSTVMGAVRGENIISVRQGATGSESSYDAEWRIYIDSNQNGTFEETENVWYWTGANTSRAIERSFTLSDTALEGKTRMRVLQSYEKLSSPCGRIRWGEVEDFTVDIKAHNPAEFNANVTANNLTVSFDDNTDTSAVASIAYDFGDGAVNGDHTGTQSDPTHTYAYTGTYTARLTATLQDGVSYVKQQDVTVSGDAYCAAYGKSTTQWTSNVRLDAINNASDKSQFTHFFDSGFTLEAGKTTEIGLTHNSGGPYLANWAVYVDLNNNNSFDDATELLLQTSATTLDEVIGSITIPQGTSPTTTVMRVMQSYELTDAKVPSCGSFGWGEVEDYTISITDGTTVPSNKLQNGVTKSNIDVVKGETKTFTFDVPQDATNINVHMGAGTGDPDLYVKFDDADTTSNWDCRPYKGGNVSETCDSSSLANTGGTYYVSVKGWTDSDNVTLTASYTDPIITPPATNICETKAPQTRGNLTNAQAICLGSNTVYVAISVPSGQSKLTINTTGGNSDASIYQNSQGWPSASNFENSATTANSSEELITINSPNSGWHYFMVTGQGTGTQFRATYE